MCRVDGGFYKTVDVYGSGEKILEKGGTVDRGKWGRGKKERKKFSWKNDNGKKVRRERKKLEKWKKNIEK